MALTQLFFTLDTHYERPIQIPRTRAEVDRSCSGKGRVGSQRMNSLTRRRFLIQGSTATAAAMLPPFFLQTSSKSGSRWPVIGSGVHTYECVHDWLVPPDGLVWGDTHGLAQDEQGNIYVAHTVNKSSMRGEAVVVYDSSGRLWDPLESTCRHASLSIL